MGVGARHAPTFQEARPTFLKSPTLPACRGMADSAVLVYTAWHTGLTGLAIVPEAGPQRQPPTRSGARFGLLYLPAARQVTARRARPTGDLHPAPPSSPPRTR